MSGVRLQEQLEDTLTLSQRDHLRRLMRATAALDTEQLIRAWGKHREHCGQAMWGKACIPSQCAEGIAAEYAEASRV